MSKKRQRKKAAAGAERVTKPQPDPALTANFEFAISAVAVIKDETDCLRLEITSPSSPYFRLPAHIVVCLEPTPGETIDDKRRALWAHHALNIYQSKLPGLLSYVALRFLALAAAQAHDESNLGDKVLPTYVADHIGGVETYLKEKLFLSAKKKPGRPAAWSAFELANKVEEALRALPKSRHSQEQVAQWLRSKYKDGAPPSRGALYQRLREAKLRWDTLKLRAANSALSILHEGTARK